MNTQDKLVDVKDLSLVTSAVMTNIYDIQNDSEAMHNEISDLNYNVYDLYSQIENLPSPMVFKGSLGTGGTITSLPTAATDNEGYTYKVITAGTYASQAAKIGDMFISDGSKWVYIPSADEPSGTVTSITLKATSPIAIDSSNAITTSGTRTISHGNSGVTAGTYRSVTVNATGHVTAGTNPTTLSGYGITDAKIASGVITLGSNTITPLTASSTLDATKVSGTLPTSTYTDTKYTAGTGLDLNGTTFSKKPYLYAYSGTSGTTGYVHICQIKVTANYQNEPIMIEYTRRNDFSNTKLYISFTSAQSTDPTLRAFHCDGYSNEAYIYKSDTSTWDVYIKKTEGYDNIGIVNYTHPAYASGISITWKNIQQSTAITGWTQATRLDRYAPSISEGTKIGTLYENGVNYDIYAPTVPTKVSELTNDSGYTTNTGTITGITMNGASKGTSGVVDLGTVSTTDTKNTAGSTDTSSKIFLIGATSQAANPQTYSDNEVYTTSGVLTTKSVQVGGTAATMQYNSTDKCIEFIFA